MTLLLRDPTAEIASALRPPRPVLDTLVGKCVALLDIGKMRGDEFIDRLEILMNARGVVTRRYKKPTNTRTAPIEIIHDIALKCHAVVIALSDCGSCTSCSTHDLFTLDENPMSAFDPKRTWASQSCCRARSRVDPISQLAVSCLNCGSYDEPK